MGNSLGDLVLSVCRDETSDRSRRPDIISFIESPWGLDRRMFPVQKVIIKALYGIKLDDKRKNVTITNWKRENEHKYTEADYLKHMFDKGRCNINTVEEGKPYGEMILPIGRRSGKTEMASWILLYETDKILSKQCPQDYYGTTPGDEIKLCAVATSRNQASDLYNKAKHYFLSCQRFDPYIANITGSFTKFQSQSDIMKSGRWGQSANPQATIRATFYSCVAKSVRGPGHMVVILDEFAHFLKKGNSSSKEVYTSILPSMSAFSPKDPDDKMIPIGPVESKMVIISSPLGKDDFFYEKWRQCFDNPDLYLAIQAPTWEVNPTIPASELEKQYLSDAPKFFVEFGAEFSDRTRGWIENRDDIINCVDRKLVRLNRSVKKQPHFAGIDVGVTRGGDGTAIAIGHVDSDKIILDTIETMVAGEGDYSDYERLSFDEIADWILDLSKRFRIDEGVMDQWAGIPMEQHIQKRGLKQIKFTNFTPTETTFIFKTAKDLMWNDSVRFYNYDDEHGIINPDEKLCSYLEELSTLQEEKVSRNISVFTAPRGEHDDRSYALVRMMWLASKRLGKKNYINGSTRDSPLTGYQIPKRGIQTVANKVYGGRIDLARSVTRKRNRWS